MANMKTEKQKMLAGELYLPNDPELVADRDAAARWMARYNATLATDAAMLHALLRERFAEVGEGVWIRPPFYCDYGYNIRMGQGSFMNFTRDVSAGASVVGNPARMRTSS